MGGEEFPDLRCARSKAQNSAGVIEEYLLHLDYFVRHNIGPKRT